MSKKNKKTIFSNSLADYSAALRQHPASPVFEQMPLALSQKHTLISQNWNLLSWSFTNSGLIQRFIMQPILDGLRGGLTITSKQLDDEEIKHLNKMYEVKAREPIRNTMIWNKLYGGAGIIINAGEEYNALGYSDYLSKPINIKELEDMLLDHIPPEKIRTIDS